MAILKEERIQITLRKHRFVLNTGIFFCFLLKGNKVYVHRFLNIQPIRKFVWSSQYFQPGFGETQQSLPIGGHVGLGRPEVGGSHARKGRA